MQFSEDLRPGRASRQATRDLIAEWTWSKRLPRIAPDAAIVRLSRDDRDLLARLAAAEGGG